MRGLRNYTGYCCSIVVFYCPFPIVFNFNIRVPIWFFVLDLSFENLRENHKTLVKLLSLLSQLSRSNLFNFMSTNLCNIRHILHTQFHENNLHMHKNIMTTVFTFVTFCTISCKLTSHLSHSMHIFFASKRHI